MEYKKTTYNPNDFKKHLEELTRKIQENQELLTQTPQIRELIDYAITICNEVNPPIQKINKEVEQKRAICKDLVKWRETETLEHKIKEQELKNQNTFLQKRIRELESVFIEEHLPKVIELGIKNNELPEIPFVYYGLNTNRIIYTDATQKLFNNNQTNKRLSLRQLFNYLKRQNTDGQDTIKIFLNALQNNKPLSFQKAQTKQGKEIHLSTKPYQFSPNDSRVIGIGISFYSPFEITSELGYELTKMHQGIEKYIQETFKKIN